ncbi:DUF551 domain-containing protein [Klebsiella pneumoniae]|uniref:DUF551 domain-containing protein n=1 Tax=Klebsiella pneumoniae TaxID=573 RepID=UPI0024DE3A6D|nr:DUF551 domain-containing protein [Klebsiella pneumoniae]MDK1749434.1 DUF551 domain-containing protein [Klebsiella pneumoniae]
MSEFSQETLLNIIETDHVQCGEASALARMALAAMDGEPVRNPVLAYADIYRDMAKQGFESVPIWSVITDLERNIAPLYRHAQPVPRVPDGYVMVPVKPTREILDEFDSIIDYGAEDSEDAWRRLLAAAPHDTPALNSVQNVDSVADRWIPVSERMPEVGVKVLCFPVKDEPIHATFNGQLWLQDVSWSGSEEPIDNAIPVTVTHWMPLPAVPQEVKGE